MCCGCQSDKAIRRQQHPPPSIPEKNELQITKTPMRLSTTARKGPTKVHGQHRSWDCAAMTAMKHVEACADAGGPADVDPRGEHGPSRPVCRGCAEGDRRLYGLVAATDSPSKSCNHSVGEKLARGQARIRFSSTEQNGNNSAIQLSAHARTHTHTHTHTHTRVDI